MKSILTNTVKITVAAVLAILCAQALKLDFAVYAGIVAILSVQPTKKETLCTALARLLAFAVVLLISITFFNLLGFTVLVFFSLSFDFYSCLSVAQMDFYHDYGFCFDFTFSFLWENRSCRNQICIFYPKNAIPSLHFPQI